MLLSGYLPPYLAETQTFTSLFNAEQIEVDGVNNTIEDIVNQCFIATATWGLDYWESFLGIAIDHAKDIEYRRTVVNAKKRGQGTVTVKLIQNVAESFSNGEVDVIEDNLNYQFTIKFTSILGIPPNLDDLKKAIEDIKPAHLKVLYEFTYNTNNTLKVMTNNMLKSFTHNELKIHKF